MTIYSIAPDTPSSTAIQKIYDYKQQKIHNSIILDDSYLGPYNHETKIKVGNTPQKDFLTHWSHFILPK